ncbi:MAG: reverse transcriptase/maturase family protein [bacterium]
MSTLFERFSSKENLKRAYELVQNGLAQSSLSVNPINHPSITAINALGDQFFIALEKHIRDGNYNPEKGFFVYIQKDNLGLRPVCILSMVDHIVYQAMFNQGILGLKIDGQLSETCYASRINDNVTEANFLNTYYKGYDAFCKKQISHFKKGYRWKIEFDVRQYFENIPIEMLISTLKNDFGVDDERILTLLKKQLIQWAEFGDLAKGIPQSPEVSNVLGNVFLSALDDYADAKIGNDELHYSRYMDDIVLMGKNKSAVLKATEKIVRFLRERNLSLNEKTKLVELENTDEIEASRITSDYENTTLEIPEDSFTQIQEKVPRIIAAIRSGAKVSKSEIGELKYFLKASAGFTLPLVLEMIQILLLVPSLTAEIIRYVGEGRNVLSIIGDSLDPLTIDNALWKVYVSDEASEWLKFWILKLLVSNKDVLLGDLRGEIERILASKEGTIFKVVGFYYQAIQNEKISFEQVKHAVEESETDIEKSLYSFFFLDALQETRFSVAQNSINDLLDATSQELNLIGCYLYTNTPKMTGENPSSEFSCRILNKPIQPPLSIPVEKPIAQDLGAVFMVRGENLIPVPSPAALLGLSRKKKTKSTMPLEFPELVQWEKVTIKIKTGLQDVEIMYDGKHIAFTDFIGLGFYSGTKDKKPDRQWTFLTTLSALCVLGDKQATVQNMMASVARLTKRTISTNNIHQMKKKLANGLRAAFKTDEDPFHEHKEYYEPRFTLLPEPLFRHEELKPLGGYLDENMLSEASDDE